MAPWHRGKAAAPGAWQAALRRMQHHLWGILAKESPPDPTGGLLQSDGQVIFKTALITTEELQTEGD